MRGGMQSTAMLQRVASAADTAVCIGRLCMQMMHGVGRDLRSSVMRRSPPRPALLVRGRLALAWRPIIRRAGCKRSRMQACNRQHRHVQCRSQGVQRWSGGVHGARTGVRCGRYPPQTNNLFRCGLSMKPARGPRILASQTRAGAARQVAPAAGRSRRTHAGHSSNTFCGVESACAGQGGRGVGEMAAVAVAAAKVTAAAPVAGNTCQAADTDHHHQQHEPRSSSSVPAL